MKIQIIQKPDEFKQSIISELKKEIESFKKEIKTNEQTEFLTRKETCKLLKISLSTLNRWANSGILKTYSAGNRIYLKRSEIEKVLKPINLSNH